jgi:phosphatidate cytidylyltransferase|tara:strand:+ start:2797 stop:3444 length:648 start_codon:yes stop_codon:yes gene_type:complete
MTNLQKRILTSSIILPLSIFFIVKGGYFLLFFLLLIYFAGLHELFNVFKRIKTKVFLLLVLTLSILSIYYLANDSARSLFLLYFVIAISISSDIGGYVFGKIFKWKKLSKISPKKTISGVFGSYFCSFICLVAYNDWSFSTYSFFVGDLLLIPEILLTIIFSTVAQAGDLFISYFKRLDKIKDTGKILPGHGGIFDRIDGLMFVAVVASIFYFVI